MTYNTHYTWIKLWWIDIALKLGLWVFRYLSNTYRIAVCSWVFVFAEQSLYSSTFHMSTTNVVRSLNLFKIIWSLDYLYLEYIASVFYLTFSHTLRNCDLTPFVFFLHFFGSHNWIHSVIFLVRLRECFSLSDVI